MRSTAVYKLATTSLRPETLIINFDLGCGNLFGCQHLWLNIT